jgi:hypothetical protein
VYAVAGEGTTSPGIPTIVCTWENVTSADRDDDDEVDVFAMPL